MEGESPDPGWIGRVVFCNKCRKFIAPTRDPEQIVGSISHIFCTDHKTHMPRNIGQLPLEHVAIQPVYHLFPIIAGYS